MAKSITISSVIAGIHHTGVGSHRDIQLVVENDDTVTEIDPDCVLVCHPKSENLPPHLKDVVTYPKSRDPKSKRKTNQLAFQVCGKKVGNQPGEKTISFLKSYCITRDLKNLTYICHWKNLFIQNEVIESRSLSFQEDNALIDTFLHYPHPIPDWKFYKTVSFYFLKINCSNGSNSLNLHRGVTNYPGLSTHKETSAKNFLSGVNHAGPGLTTIQSWLPTVSYENDQYHKKYVLCHIKTLMKNNALALKFDGVTRFPVVMGIDEQELNQGTFSVGEVLHGLKEKLSAADIRNVGLDKFASYLSQENSFVTSVREYRLIDFNGLMCSNAFTSYVSGSLKSNDCIKSLNMVSKLANQCEHCLRNSMTCSYELLNEKCDGCRSSGSPCVSINVFHVLWDMGSSQVKSAAECVERLTKETVGHDHLRSDRFTVGFGMLHILKAITNKLRNYCLSLNGENYGVHILRAMKNEDDEAAMILRNLKNAVIVGKDRQSDYLSNMTSGKIVQDALTAKKNYLVTRVPEAVLAHKENANKQKNMIYPVSVACNDNGDSFILDAGAACVHVYDHFTVTKLHLIGNYCKPCVTPYPPTGNANLKGKDVKLSNRLLSMTIHNNDLYVVDGGRKELVILRKCLLAKNIRTSLLHICEGSFSSIASCNDGVVVLRNDVIDILLIRFPPARKYSLRVKEKLIRTIKPSQPVRDLFGWASMEYCFGAVRHSDQEVVFYFEESDFDEHPSGIKSVLPPCVTPMNLLVTVAPSSAKANVITFHSVDIDDDGNLVSTLESPLNVPLLPSAVASWGSTLQIIGKDVHGYKLQEWGPLNFGLRLSKAINLAYDAIGYLPPHGLKDIPERLFPQMIEESKVLAAVLNEMQDDGQRIFPTRSRFGGNEGKIFSQTVECLNSTIEDWEILSQRIEFMDPSLVEGIRARSISNEGVIEHAFGFVTLKSGKQLQDMYEYIHNKSRHELDFQMRLTQLPFCQCTKVKLRDKSYQHIDSSTFSKMDMDDFWDIFCDTPNVK